MTVTTSGTVGLTPYNQGKVIEHALRRAGFKPEKIGAEGIQVAQDCLFTTFSEYANAGFPLWTRQYLLLAIAQGLADVQTPSGTMEVLNSFWRILQPYRGAATLSTGAGNTTLFGGAPNADVVIAGANPAVAVNFASATELDTIGVLLGGNAAVTAALNVNTSVDGVTWTLSQTLPSTTFTPNQWAYFDLGPTITAQYVQLQYVTGGSWTLNQLNFGLANGVDIPLGLENIDSYYNLPDKMMQGDRPNTVYQDRQIANPVLKIWPVPSSGAFYAGTVTALVRRYIQDPGLLTNNLEVPPRWLEAVQWRLATRLIFELPDDAAQQGQSSFITLSARQQRIDSLEKQATRAEAMMWAEERNRAPIRIAPSISPYTR